MQVFKCTSMQVEKIIVLHSTFDILRFDIRFSSFDL